MVKNEEIFAEKPNEGEPWDIIIIGSGPAAFTAAIYTTRGAASSMILGGDTWGGQLMLTTTVDNFPGFLEGVQGPELMDKMRSQAERFGAEFKAQKVTKVDFDKEKVSLDPTQVAAIIEDADHPLHFLTISSGFLGISQSDDIQAAVEKRQDDIAREFDRIDNPIEVAYIVGGYQVLLDHEVVQEKFIELLKKEDECQELLHLFSNATISKNFKNRASKQLAETIRDAMEGRGSQFDHCPATDPLRRGWGGFLVRKGCLTPVGMTWVVAHPERATLLTHLG